MALAVFLLKSLEVQSRELNPILGIQALGWGFAAQSRRVSGGNRSIREPKGILSLVIRTEGNRRRKSRASCREANVAHRCGFFPGMQARFQSRKPQLALVGPNESIHPPKPRISAAESGRNSPSTRSA